MSLTNRILLAMVAGVLVGSLLNLLVGSGATPEAADNSLTEIATNLDHLATGKPLINVIRPPQGFE